MPDQGQAQTAKFLQEWESGSTTAALRRRFGRFAGALFILGGIAGTPAILFHHPALPVSTLALTAVAVCSGLICLAVPWERVSARWFHLVTVAATIEVLAVVVMVAPVFSWYWLLVVVYAAYVFPSRGELALQVGFICAAAMAPALLGLDGYPLVETLVMIPTLVISGTVVWVLREELEKGQAGYRRLSRLDPLTGVGNYREMHESLAIEVGRHARARMRFALILVDLDEFKAVNDDQGHLEGDRVLREVGAGLGEAVRRRDTVARHGGDEFSVIAPESSEGEGRDLALRLEQAVSRLVTGERALAACTGVAIYPDHGQDADTLIAHADHSLRQEKRARRALAGRAAGRQLSERR